VVMPGRPDELAETIRRACMSADSSLAERAVAIAGTFSLERAMASYARLIDRLLQPAADAGRPT
jgi:colanic acid biosynthesis glycosyl transferase WcaI